MDIGVLGDDDDLEGGVDAGQWSERLERSDEVEECESGVQDEGDLDEINRRDAAAWCAAPSGRLRAAFIR